MVVSVTSCCFKSVALVSEVIFHSAKVCTLIVYGSLVLNQQIVTQNLAAVLLYYACGMGRELGPAGGFRCALAIP